MNAALLRDHAQTFVDTFARYWPPEVDCILYHEEPSLDVGVQGRFRFAGLMAIPAAKEFLDATRDDPLANGFVDGAMRGKLPGALRAVGESYKFRHDAHRFAHKVFAICDPTREDDGEFDVVMWLDADVVTTQPVTMDWINRIVAPDVCVTYLGRGRKETETGFLGFRPKLFPEELARFKAAFVGTYCDRSVFRRKHQNDGYVFDEVLRETGISSRDLTGHLGMGIPFDACILAERMRHRKGWRKYK